MGKPAYVTELQTQLKEITGKIGSTEGAIIRIDTTLSQTLPKIESGLTLLNGTVRKHETEIALQQQAHEDCPARNAYQGNPGAGAPRQVVIDLSDNRTKVAVGGVLGAPALLLLLEIAKLLTQHYWGG